MNKSICILLSFYVFLEHLTRKIHFLDKLVGSPLQDTNYDQYKILDELYGSGDFDENITMTQDVDRHMASSVESLIRLFIREKDYVKYLRESIDEAGSDDSFNSLVVKEPMFPEDKDEFLNAAAIGKNIYSEK